MRLILLAFLFLFLGGGAGAQSVSSEHLDAPTWREHIALRMTAQAFQPFVIDKNAPDIGTDIKNPTFLRLNPQELQRLLTERPRDLRFQIPTALGEPLTVELFESDPSAPNKGTWAQEVDGLKKVSVARGLHYWGIVAGKINSSVAFSFYENQVFGVLLAQDGNYNFGVYGTQANPSVNDLYILYNDKDAKYRPDFSCGTKELQTPIKKKIEEQAMTNATTCKQVVIYFEADLKLYTDLGSSVPNVVNYINALFNEVAIIYANENITIALGDIKVWTVADPYTSLVTREQYLDEFRINQIPANPFTWDLAHLVTTKGVGGLAYLYQICATDRTYRTAVSGSLNPVVVPYPTYTYNLYLVSHELGHNFGSQHTHWCWWPGGPIDGCAPVEGGGCTQIPSVNPGTIMSYCTANIDLTLGFGPLPGNEIRSRYNNGACLTTVTVTADITAPSQEPFILCSIPGNVDLTAAPCTGCTYQWYVNGTAIGGATSNTYNATQAGAYFIAVKKGACLAVSPVKNLVAQTAPCVGNGTITNNRPDVACGTAPSGTLTLSGYTGTVVAWQISTDNFVTHTVVPITTNTFDYPALSQTTCYRVQIAGVPTLSAPKCITVLTPPTITASSDLSMACLNTQFHLSAKCATCVSYSWSPTDGLVNPDQAVATLTFYGPSTFTVIGTDNNGCTNSATVTVTSQSYGGTIELLTPNVCEGDQAVYQLNNSPSGGFVNKTWQEQPNCTGPWINGNGFGQYTLVYSPTLMSGKTCYRVLIYPFSTNCQYVTNTDTLNVCGTVRFTCSKPNYTEKFNSWRPTPLTVNTCSQSNAIDWRDDISVPGWYAAALGAGTLNYNVQDGNCRVQGMGAYGNAGSSERSIGTWNDSPAANASVGLKCVNSTGRLITSLTVSYTGEQWFRNDNFPTLDRLDFQYSLNAAALNNGTWTDFDALDFSSPQVAVTGALNGNSPPYRTHFYQTITGVNIPAGQTFWLRWTDFNQTGLSVQDQLSIDDVSVTVNFTGGLTPPVTVTLPAQHCPNSTQTYTVTPVAGTPPVAYNWSIPGGCTGWALSSLNGTISTTMNITAGSGNCNGIRVQAVDECGASAFYNFDINLSDCSNLAGAVLADQSICYGSSSPSTLNLSGQTGTVMYWESSTDCPSFNTANIIAITTTSYTPLSSQSTTCYRAIVNTADGPKPSNPATVTSVRFPTTTNNYYAYAYNVCTGGCANMLLYENVGTIQWQKQDNCVGGFTNIPGANYQNLVQCNLTQKTCFRAILSNPPCADAVPFGSIIIDVGASFGPSAGTVAATNANVCPGGCTDLTLSGHTGTDIQWQQDAGCLNVYADIDNGSLANFQACNITQTTCYRAKVSQKTCDPAFTAPYMINVNPALAPNVSLNALETTICAGTCLDLNASGATIYTWMPGNLTGSTVNVCPLTTTTYTITGMDAVGCSGTATITIVADLCTPVGGNVSPAQTICSGTAPATLSLQNHVGNVIRWESSTDNFATITTIAHTNTSYDSGTLTQTTCFRAVVELNPHPVVFSVPACITIIPPVAQGSITPVNTSVCSGNVGSNLFLSGHSGTIIRWEKSNDNFATVTSIAHTNAIFTGAGTITTRTCFRAVISNGGCPSVNSATACMTAVLPPVSGTLASAQTICEGSSATVTLSGNTANVIRWETSTDNFAVNVTTINQTTTNFTANNVTGTLAIRAVVSNGLCPAVYSNVVTIVTVPISLGGTLPGDRTVCADNNAGTLILSNYTGNILHWEVSTDNFTTFSTIANQTPQFTYTNLPVTTWFRVALGGLGGACLNVKSSVVKITAVKTAVGGILNNIRGGEGCSIPNGTLLLTGYSGRIIRWESSINNFTNVTSIANTTASLNYNVNMATQYRVVLQNVPCPVVYSQVITVNGGMILNATALRECNNKGKIVAIASGGIPAYSYFMTPNSGSQLQAGIFTNVTPGTYTVTARDQNNCTVTRTVTIPSQVSGPYLTGVTFNGLNNARVDWTDVAPGGNTVYYQLRYRKTGGTSWVTKNVGSNNTYMLVNLDTVGIRTYEVQVRVRCLPSTVYGAWSGVMNFSLRTEETFANEGYLSDQDLTLYPNPNNGSFRLHFGGEATENEIQIFDMTGKKIYQRTFISSELQNECTVDLLGQASGIYWVVVQQGHLRKKLKVVIE